VLLISTAASGLGGNATGVAGIGLFLAVEARTPYPILSITLLRDNPVFALSNLAALFNYAAPSA